MSSNSSVVPLRQPDTIDDPLTAILQERRAPAACPGDRGGSRRVPGRDEGPAPAGRARARCPPRARPGAPDPDRHRPGRGGAGEAARPRRRRGWGRAHPLHLGDPAALGPADAEPGCAAADPLSARGLDGRLPGGARRPAGQRRSEPVAAGDRAAARTNGRRTTSVGSGAISPPGATSTSGPTASTCRRAWNRRPSACWC